MKNVQLMFGDKSVKSRRGGNDAGFDAVVELECELLWQRNGRWVRDGGRAKVDPATRNCGENEFVHTKCRCPVHTRVFTEETRSTIVIDNN